MDNQTNSGDAQPQGFAKKKDRIVVVRMDSDSVQRLSALSQQWGVNRSEVLRRLLRLMP